jgi:hypothetical protein
MESGTDMTPFRSIKIYFLNRKGETLWATKVEKKIRKKARNKATRSRARKTRRRLINNQPKRRNGFEKQAVMKGD